MPWGKRYYTLLWASVWFWSKLRVHCCKHRLLTQKATSNHITEPCHCDCYTVKKKPFESVPLHVNVRSGRPEAVTSLPKMLTAPFTWDTLLLCNSTCLSNTTQTADIQLVTPGSPYTSRMKKKKIKKEKQGMGAAPLLRCHLPALREATTSETERAREPSKLKGTWRSSHRGCPLEIHPPDPNPDSWP